MKTIKRHLLVLISLVLMSGVSATLSLAAPTYPLRTGALLLTPTPNPTVEPGQPPLAASQPQFAASIQKLNALIAALQAEAQNLIFQLFNPEPPTSNPNRATIQEPESQPCPDSDFTCIILTVPLDHFDPANPQTIEVVFGVLPATGERKGMFVNVEGGPGGSGLAIADSYTAAFDPSITAHFDVVFFDQRGMGQSGGLQCPLAAVAYYQAETDALTPAGEAATIAAADTFADACLAELGSSKTLLPYLSTRQAIEDLELFRQAMGDEQFWLYGLSYGTQFAQTYAAAYPEHLAGLILDGTVDLTLSGPVYLREQAQAFNDVLVMTLEACNEDEACAADMGQDAVAFYDELAAQLSQGPLAFTFPLPSGGGVEREITLTDLEVATTGYLYSEFARLLLQRALTAAAQGDLVPLARLVYDSYSLDPETLEVEADPGYSDAGYYGVECLDYAYYPDQGPSEQAEAYIRAGDEADQTVPRLSSIFYGDLPCVFWPAQLDDPQRPEPLNAEGIPTLVLGATADPATPVANGERVFSHLADGYLVTMEGGPHVIFGWGNACPDDLVTAYLVADEVPAQRETICEGVVADSYVPLPPADASAFANPLQALYSADTEINHLTEYYYWDYETPTSVGCPHGGTLAFEAGDEGDAFTLTDCAFSAGFEMSGSGLYRYDDGSFTLDLAVIGPQDAVGNLSYERDENGAIRVTGDYDGQPIDLSD